MIQSLFAQPSVFKGPMHLVGAETISQKQKEGSLGRKVSGSVEEGDSELDRHRLISGDEYCRRRGRRLMTGQAPAWILLTGSWLPWRFRRAVWV